MDDDLRPAPAAAVSIAPVSADDLGELLALVRAMNAEDGHPLTAAGEAAVRQLCAGEPLAHAWLARGGGALGYVVLTVGFTIEYGGRDGFVDELYVVPEARGRGLGLRLLDVAEQAARGLGVVALHLEVARANTRAKSLYRRRGYFDNDRQLLTKRLRESV